MESQGASPAGRARMKVAIAIPARFASTRLPGKMLLEVNGRPLIQYTWERARASRLASSVVIVTDDERIATAARAFGAVAEMTSPDCASGTDRVAQLVRSGRLDADIVVNVQGDEPEMDPALIDAAAEILIEDEAADIATLAVPVASLEEYNDPNAVKVVIAADGRALYFSRAPVPFVRDGVGDAAEAADLGICRHIGLYACRREALLEWTSAPETHLERLEKLEQLRALECGLRIRVATVAQAPPGIDTLEDFKAFEKRRQRE